MPPKNDKKPLCPIPEDAKKGDVVVLRCGQKRTIESGCGGIYCYDRPVPSLVMRSGAYDSPERPSPWDCIQFIRATPKKPGKVKADPLVQFMLSLEPVNSGTSEHDEITVKSGLTKAQFWRKCKAVATRLQSLSRKGEE